MKGRTVRTPERVAEALRLREQGLTYRQIGDRFGVSLKTVADWVLDPDGAKRDGRKRSYGGTCDICGGPTKGHDGPGSAAKRCMECIEWTRESVLLAIQEYVEEHGEPPRQKTPGLPMGKAVTRLFGSWNNALLAAGQPLVCDRREEVWAEVRRRVLAGEAVNVIAAERGCTPHNIYGHLRAHGIYLVGPQWWWSDEEILAAIRSWTRAHGKPPTARQWRLAGPDHPAYLTVAKRFGSWGASIARALESEAAA